MASGIYSCFKEDLMTKAVDLVNDTINVALYDNSHVFTATDTTYTTTNELATSGNYTQGGVALSGKSVTAGTTTKWDATDASWANGTFTAYHAVLYDVTNGNSLIASIDFGGAKTVAAETFKIRWDNALNAILTLATV